MKNIICGITITEQHAKAITNTITRVYAEIEKRKRREFMSSLRYTLNTNPHNTFKGTAEVYINKYGVHV